MTSPTICSIFWDLFIREGYQYDSIFNWSVQRAQDDNALGSSSKVSHIHTHSHGHGRRKRIQEVDDDHASDRKSSRAMLNTTHPWSLLGSVRIHTRCNRPLQRLLQRPLQELLGSIEFEATMLNFGRQFWDRRPCSVCPKYSQAIREVEGRCRGVQPSCYDRTCVGAAEQGSVGYVWFCIVLTTSTLVLVQLINVPLPSHPTSSQL
jgi:hypothetical protein